MVEKVSAEQAYMNRVMCQLPKAERGDVYEVKAKDSLWNIAKKRLSSKNQKVTNAQIQDYMYQIAKLNELTTVEKMNKLKVSDKIYFPKETTAPQKTTAKKTDKAKTVTATTKKAVKKEAPKPKNSAETSVTKLTDQIKTDRTVKVEKMYKGYKSQTDMYHVYNDYKDPKTGYMSRKHPLLSFCKDNKTGIITEITFNDQQSDKDPVRYDYKMDSKGNIIRNNIIRQTPQGKISSQEVQELHNLLNSKISANVPYSY